MKRRARRKRPPYDEWVKLDQVWNWATRSYLPADGIDGEGETFANSRYVVSIDPWVCAFLPEAETGSLLSIKLTEGGPVDDWRDKQRIKNDLCGPEREGVELFPAESRLMDVADQAWIQVLPEGLQWPFGYQERAVAEGRHVRGRRGTQRPFELRPEDCLSADEKEEQTRAHLARSEPT